MIKIQPFADATRDYMRQTLVRAAQRDVEDMVGISNHPLGRLEPMKLNHGADGGYTVTDLDLQQIELSHCSLLPWLIYLIEEIQYLRDVRLHDSKVIEDMLVDDDPDARIAYLEGVLDRIGATYDGDKKSD